MDPTYVIRGHLLESERYTKSLESKANRAIWETETLKRQKDLGETPVERGIIRIRQRIRQRRENNNNKKTF